MTRASSKLSTSSSAAAPGGGGDILSSSTPRNTRTTRRSVAAAAATSSSSSALSPPASPSVATTTTIMETAASPPPVPVAGRSKSIDDNAEAATPTRDNRHDDDDTPAPSTSCSEVKISELTINSSSNSGIAAIKSPEIMVKVETEEEPTTTTTTTIATEAEATAAVNSNDNHDDVTMKVEGDEMGVDHSPANDENVNEGGMVEGSAANSIMEVDQTPQPLDSEQRTGEENAIVTTTTTSQEGGETIGFHDDGNLPTITEEKCDDSNMSEAAKELTCNSSVTAPTTATTAATVSSGMVASEPTQVDFASTDNSEIDVTTNGDSNNNCESISSSPPSFSMTLAIGPADAQRAFHASMAFNAEIQKLQSINNDAGIDSSEEGVAVTTERMEPTKRKSMDSEKKKPAIVHSPPSRTEDILKKSSTPSMSSSVAADALATAIPHLEEVTKPPSPQTSPHSQKLANQPLQQPQPQSLINLLIPAAKNTNDALICTFLSQLELQNKSVAEQQVSLLFFLDADKSTKLLAAFEALSNHDEDDSKKFSTSSPTRHQPNLPFDESNDTSISSSSKLVARNGLIHLFQSFLTSISTCVHGGDSSDDEKKEGGAVSFQEDKPTESRSPTPTMQNTSPSTLSTMNQDASKNGGNTSASDNVLHGDWKGSARTQREILEVATFAADNLIEYARKEGADESDKSSTIEGGVEGKGELVIGVTFDTFGKWYNSGGFSRVPWLELLDLTKWDYSGGGGSNSIPTPGGASSSVYPFQEESATSSSSTKRAKLHNSVPFTPGVSTMKEPIGSPTSFFASAAMLEATPRPPPSQPTTTDQEGVQSFSAMFGEMDESRTVVSFDFSGSTPSSNQNASRSSSSFHIDITEENLVMLRNLVRRTGLASMTPQHVESLMLKHARIERHKYGETIYVISRSQFGKFIREVVPKESSKNFDSTEIENFSNYFTNFFTCFDYSWSDLKRDEVNARELMVGFTFLFAGNKSLKLAAAFEMLDADRAGYLTQRGLMQYLRSYLTMLAGISLLSANKKTTTQIRKNLMSSKRDDAFLAVENGAKWTMSHFMRAFEQEMHSKPRNSTRCNAVTFEDFAKWYTEGGYAVAPWLELLDLQKFLSLIGESSSSKYPPDSNDQSLAEVLFTFPLAKSRSLIVLRDDAHYVRSVVNELGLLSLTSEDIWSILFNDVANSLVKEGQENTKSMRMQVDQMTFVHCMMRILSGTGKIKQHSSQWPDFSPEETLKNFYLSFDLADTKRVPLNHLMCGLTLLCGGKKSNKLVFAFGLCCGEDSSKGGKKKTYMTHDDFFYFFRSFLIVMFSCCNQSLSLSADAVTQYISDTAKMVADDVTSYWKAKQVEKIKFENFSEWYNEGGFETAPWLELLDLNKWVLADQAPPAQQREQHPHQPHQFQEQQPTLSQPNQPPEVLTPATEAIKGLLATPKIKANDFSPFDPHCPPAPDDDHLFDLDIVDAEEDAMVSVLITCMHL